MPGLVRRQEWLRGLDSNQDNQLQRLACYQLHYPGMAEKVYQKRRALFLPMEGNGKKFPVIQRSGSFMTLQCRMPARDAVHRRYLWLIAAFKLFKGFVLLGVGIGALKLMHKDLAMEVDRWADMFRVDPGNYYIHRFLAKFSLLDDRKLRELSVGTFFYSALLLTEGTGLMLEKVWAEYFTIFTTSSFIPLEIYELVKRVSFAKGVVLLLNIAVVAYLVVDLGRNRKNSRVESESSRGAPA